jgi:hypothetical protein
MERKIMEAISFVYWLQGYLELSNVTELDTDELAIVKEHIALVLKKVTPPPALDPNYYTIPYIGTGEGVIC